MTETIGTDSITDQPIVGKARISSYKCGYCYDSGIQQGTAELDGQIVVVSRICCFCNVAKAAYKEDVKKDEVKYDF